MSVMISGILSAQSMAFTQENQALVAGERGAP